MASPQARAHIEAQRRLRSTVASAAVNAWRGLPGWDRTDIERFTAYVVPLVLTGQRTSVALTNAYLARYLQRAPLGIPVGELLGAGVRNGVAPQEVYSRPFVTLWSGLQEGKPFEDAFRAAQARVESTAAMDVQLSMRATFDAAEKRDERIFGYERVADGGACAFCLEVDGAFVKSGDAMALHNNCGCSLEPLTEPYDGAVELPPGVAVHEHGELGAVLADPAHSFTDAAQALS